MKMWTGFSRRMAVVILISFLAAGLVPRSKSQQAAATPPQQTAPPAPILKATSRLVTLQVLARDRQGHPVPGLTAKDFQLFEEVPPKKDKRAQQIAAFQFVSVAAIAAADKGVVQMPAGVYSNLVSMRKAPVPPTVLFVDGLNTSITVQMQVHRQMVKLLASIPEDVPVSVFLLDRNLHLLQDFTTDPKLLREAAKKAISLDSAGLADVDPRDDPDALSAQLEDVPGASLDSLERFERETFSAQMDIRVQATLDALRAIARHLSGYPGRKNLLWVSSSFPIQIAPDSDNKFVGLRNYDDRMVEVAYALADAKVAVYPMDAGGLQTQSYMQASSRTRGAPSGRSMGASIQREDVSRFSKQESMGLLADGTGGRICVNDNDLSDCVKKAMDDGSSYYEIAYYPDATNWNGEFHKVIVKTPQSGIKLAYRTGYYAPADFSAANGKDEAKLADKEMRQAACLDLLTSTALLVVAKAIPADQPGQAKYFMAIEPKMLTFAPVDGGGRSLRMDVGICTFGPKGKALQYFSDHSEQKFAEKEYASTALHAVPHVIQFAPAPDIARVRLVVRDSGSGQMGSVDIPYVAVAQTPTAPPASTNPTAPKP